MKPITCPNCTSTRIQLRHTEECWSTIVTANDDLIIVTESNSIPQENDTFVCVECAHEWKEALKIKRI